MSTAARPRWLGLMATALITFACGSSGTAATATPSAPAGQASAPGHTAAAASQATEGPAATDSGGSSGDVIQRDLPKIVDGAWTKGTAHIEVTGGRSVTFDAPGSAAGVGGTGVLTFINATASQSFTASVSNAEQSGLSITSGTFVAAGTGGQECQLKITRNETAGLAGEFSCSNALAAESTTGQTFNVNIRGSFSATP